MLTTKSSFGFLFLLFPDRQRHIVHDGANYLGVLENTGSRSGRLECLGDRYTVVSRFWGPKLSLEKDGALFATAIPDGARERYAVKVGGKFPTLQASEYTLKPVRWIDWLRGRAKFAGSTFVNRTGFVGGLIP